MFYFYRLASSTETDAKGVYTSVDFSVVDCLQCAKPNYLHVVAPLILGAPNRRPAGEQGIKPRAPRRRPTREQDIEPFKAAHHPGTEEQGVELVDVAGSRHYQSGAVLSLLQIAVPLQTIQ